VTPPTKKWPSPRWISSEGGLGITLCLLSFTNLLSVFRLLLGNTGQWAEIAFGLSVLAISVLFWLLTVWKYHVQISKFSFAVAAFFAYSVFRFVAAGVPISFMWVFVIEGWVAFCVASLISTFPRQYLVLLCIGLTVNGLVASLPIQGFQDALDAVTVAGNWRGQEGVGLFGTRSTGLLAGAGLASYDAVIGLAGCLVMAITDRRWFWHVGIVGSILLGLGTGNRSFLLGSLGIVVLLPPLLILLRGRVLKGLGFLLLLVGLVSGLVVVSGMAEQYSSRLAENTLDRDWETRFTGDAGIIPGINAALRAPLFGFVVYDPLAKDYYTFDGERTVQPHHAWVYLAATRGIPAAFVVFCVAMVGLRGIFLGIRSKQTHANLALAYGLIFMTGQLVCLTDPFLETAATVAAIGFGLHQLKQRRPDARRRSRRSRPNGAPVSPGSSALSSIGEQNEERAESHLK
jgi:hypothetical protein